ncbi:ABC transporter ATP-binding protein [Parablautia intestinalis]|uniref:ABC transporter ATP-binding protein n=1 Tax=Parablautia intestinalis TaxID=2320100 RepID=A0A3A9AMI7_9FIRM|nr:ABC transporter ATP-binding protein [Parablautia intestinalis]RKI88671.1 ABC transporter ATP-binding protein [Parablautia intestinalis]
MYDNLALEVQHVSIDYRDLTHMSLAKSLRKGEVRRANVVRAVNNISFSVNQGEILGIVGRNGSGKTTLLRSVAGIFQPDEGVIDTHGNRVSLMAIGIGFNANNTGRENILKSGMLLGCKMSYIKEHMDEIIEFSELGDFIDRPVRTYSSGMYSKLSFAVTAILDTDIMLVDEVLSVGDEKFRKKSFKKMEQLMQSDRTVLIVSHATNTLEQFCNRVLWINDGQFMMIGETDTVLAAYNESMQL